jgi:hypothetical protein
MTKSWETYEDVARQLLAESRAHFGLAEVQGKQSVPGKRSKATWEIEAKGVDTETGQFVIIECRRYPKKRLNQEALGGLAWRIEDTGAKGGIVVSPLPLQEGAKKVAAAARVTHVQLNADATPREFTMRFLDQIRVGFADDANLRITEHLTITVQRPGQPDEVIEIIDENNGPAADAAGPS